MKAMPYKPKRKNKSRVAADHEYDQRRKRNPRLREAKRIRDSAQWQRFRKWFGERHPLCCDPFDTHEVRAMDQVHHIVPIGERPELALVESNCAPLCTACHAQIEAMERRGESTQGLFGEWMAKE
jgi:5-methylcytosine-specific restriction endonuclease McrA